MKARAGAFSRSVLCAAFGCLLVPEFGYGAPAPEYSLKAAFIYNFALFTTFQHPPENTMNLCVLGRDPFGEALDPLEGRAVGAAKIAIRTPRTVADAVKRCHLLYVSASESDNMAAIADSARDAGLLTIADTKGAARKGIMIELLVEDRKIAFEFNQEAARAAHIAISSKLLRLAKTVY